METASRSSDARIRMELIGAGNPQSCFLEVDRAATAPDSACIVVKGLDDNTHRIIDKDMSAPTAHEITFEEVMGYIQAAVDGFKAGKLRIEITDHQGVDTMMSLDRTPGQKDCLYFDNYPPALYCTPGPCLAPTPFLELSRDSIRKIFPGA